MERHLLVVLFGDVSRATLEAAVEAADPGTGISVYIVSPSPVGALDWLATDARRADGEAAARVLEAEWLLEGVGELGGEVGDRDAVLAVQDVLERFPADEIALVGSGAVDPQLLAALRALGPPVTLHGLSEGSRSLGSALRSLSHGMTSGRSDATPFVAFLAANLGFLALALAISIVVGLVIWLADAFA